MPQSKSTALSHSHTLCRTAGIAGGSGCGKTTLVNAWIELASIQVTVLSQDLYYRDLSHLSLPDRAKTNFDRPDALQSDLMARHIKELASGHSVMAPVYDFSLHTRVGEQKIVPGDMLVIEGTLVLSIPELRSRMDVSIFLDTPDEIRLQRRIARDQTVRGRTKDDIIQNYHNIVRPMYNRFIAPVKHQACIILDGTKPVPVLAQQLNDCLTDYFQKTDAHPPNRR